MSFVLAVRMRVAEGNEERVAAFVAARAEVAAA